MTLSKRLLATTAFLVAIAMETPSGLLPTLRSAFEGEGSLRTVSGTKKYLSERRSIGPGHYNHHPKRTW